MHNPVVQDPSLPPPPGPSPYPDPIPGIIEFGTVSIFAGAPGVGKTTLMADWCRRWQDGKSINGFATNAPTGVCYISADRGGVTTKKLFQQHDFGNFTYYNLIDDPTFDKRRVEYSKGALEVLQTALDKVQPQPGNMVYIDPASPFFVPGSPNDPRAVARMLWYLHDAANRYRVTFICLCHFGKQIADAGQRYQRPQDRISGSGAWSGFSDTQMYLVDPEPGELHHTFGWNPRHNAPADFKYIRDAKGFRPYRPLEDVGTAVTVSQEAHRIYEAIPEGAMGIKTGILEKQVCVALGFSRKTFYRKLEELDTLGAIDRSRHGYIKRKGIDVEPDEGETPTEH